MRYSKLTSRCALRSHQRCWYMYVRQTPHLQSVATTRPVSRIESSGVYFANLLYIVGKNQTKSPARPGCHPGKTTKTPTRVPELSILRTRIHERTNLSARLFQKAHCSVVSHAHDVVLLCTEVCL